MCDEGRGVQQSNVNAYMWLSLSMSRSDGDLMEKTVEARDRIAAALTPAQLAEAQRLAREWDAAHPRK